MFKKIALVAAALSFSALASAEIAFESAQKFLSPNEAFQVNLVTSDKKVELDFDIAEGYQLYRDKLSVVSKTELVDVDVMQDSIPEATIKHYPALGESIAIYESDLKLQLFSSAPSGTEVFIDVKYQGCASSGLCYPPQSKVLSFIMQ